MELIGIAIFIILLAVIYNTLKDNSFFQGKTCLPVSVCVALLCIIGLRQFLASAPKEDFRFDFILLPYAALAISILLISLLLFLKRLRKGGNARRKDCKQTELKLECKLEDNEKSDYIRMV